MTSEEYLDDLEAKAREAAVLDPGGTGPVESAAQGRARGTFRALASSAAVLELIERVRTAERELAQYHKTSGRGLGNYGC